MTIVKFTTVSLVIALLNSVTADDPIVISDGPSKPVVTAVAESHANVTEVRERFAIILRAYCREEPNFDDQVLNATIECFPVRRQLNKQLLNHCESQAYGDDNSTPNQRRIFNCLKNSDPKKQEFRKNVIFFAI